MVSRTAPRSPAQVLAALAQIEADFEAVHRAAFSCAPVAVNRDAVELDADEAIAAAKSLARLASRILGTLEDAGLDADIEEVIDGLDEVQAW